ncbi:MAG TPA: hypothetical protein VKH35_11655 [Thermoanaerobaculia bacterium]|nr:hypothetical protein [Thermoanaerobaculia bacterium]
MKSTLTACFAVLLALNGYAAQQQILSKVYTIDRKYRSMEGPSSVQKIYLGDPAKPELLWITGMRTEMVAADGSTPQPSNLMCHVNIDLDTALHQALFDFSRPTAARLMTLSQGMLSATLPPGYGFPIVSSEPLLLFTQVLNLNIDHPKDLEVRHRVTIDYVRDADLKAPMKPLFNLGASGMVQLQDNALALASMTSQGEHHGPSCLIGVRAPQAQSSSADYVDPSGRHMTGHWTVPPGRQVNASDITWFLNLPYDTKLHYAAVHLHPFAESLTIRDTTTGRTIMTSHATNPEVGIGLTHVDAFSSEAGVILHKDHKYELISVYDNTSGANADSMASAFLGLDDPEFHHPTAETLARRLAVIRDSRQLVIHTSAGDVTALLAREAAPSVSIQVARLALAGVFDHATTTSYPAEVRIEVPVTREVFREIQPLDADRGLPPEAGTIAYCPPAAGSPDVRLEIRTEDVPVSDGRCVGFARLGGGQTVVRALHEAPKGVSAFVRSIDSSR